MRIEHHWGDKCGGPWSDWKWQMENRFSQPAELKRVLPDLKIEGEFYEPSARQFRFALTPFYARLITAQGQDSPLWKQVIPSALEFDKHPVLTQDPLAEHRDSPVAGLIHRYENRVLLLLTNRCAVYCRYCNRRRCALGMERDASINQIQDWLQYLSAHHEINEVILSGGDPLTVSDEYLQGLLDALRKIPTIEIVRICSRMPVVLPYRITTDLCAILRTHQPLYLNIHVNHPCELSEEMRQACERLADDGIPLGSQTVLLRGINDEVPILKELFRRLLSYRIKPYSLYHADPVQGTAHFRTSLSRGLEIMQSLIKELSGLAVPHYVLDAPQGRGKISLLPESILNQEGSDVHLRSLKGETIVYPDGEA